MAVVLRQPPCWYSLGVHSASNCWSAPRLVYAVSVTTLDGPDHLPSLAGEVGAAGVFIMPRLMAKIWVHRREADRV